MNSSKTPTPAPRLQVPSIDEILGLPFKVLDDGFVRVVDYMGSDESIVRAARVSYGQGTRQVHEDRGLIRYLMRHRHTTPFEMCEIKLHVRVPMDCWRQWIRHRTACLAGNVQLHFDLPGGISRRGNQLYKKTVREVYEAFQPTKAKARPDRQGDPFRRRTRVQNMLLRCLNEDTGTVQHTKITDIWESGVKQVYWVETAKGASATMSADHLCRTDYGWARLRDFASLSSDSKETQDVRLLVSGPYTHGVIPHFVPIDKTTEDWSPARGWEKWYEVSNHGRVRRVVGGKGSRSFGRCKKVTISNGRAVVSLNRPNTQEVALVHRLVLETFVGACPKGLQCCHNDGNALNNYVGNLRWDTPKSNASDRIRDKVTSSLKSFADPIVRITPVGKEMTYDLEVEGPWYNFSAGGIIVHNSVNEYSTRYSIAIDSAQRTPANEWRKQSRGNRQGSLGFVDEDLDTLGIHLSQRELELQEHAREVYGERLEMGVAREQARKDLPLSTYTEAYWKIDLHNLLRFLSLRLDSTAQIEIRLYAEVIANEMVARWCPIAWEAFRDYELEAKHFTRLEMQVLRAINAGENERAVELARGFGWLDEGRQGLKGNRERTEFEEKLIELGQVIPWRE